jgi:peptidoglycan/LPS O-acetylase OafA/YrhL
MTAGPESEARYVFLDYLRAFAAWLVVWDHLANHMPEGLGQILAPAAYVRAHFTAPLGIIQDFGWFGVALFFLISGFIISDRARVEGLFEFAVRRILRIYPMLAVAVLLSAAFMIPRDQVSPEKILLNLTLVNYVMVPQVALVGVAWTLVIEMVFYALTALTQFARESPHRIGVNLIVVALVIWKISAFGPQFSLFGVAVSYVPILTMGQTIYWWLARGRLSAAWGLGYLLAAYGVFVWGLKIIQPTFLTASNSYLVSVAYALLLFVVLLRARLPERRFIRLLSDTSYSMYLMHGIVGWLVLVALVNRIPLAAAILVATLASLGASLLTHRLVELPTQRLGRRLTRSRQLALSPQLEGGS